MSILVGLIVVLIAGIGIYRQFLLINKLIPHWESVLAKKHSLPKYELSEKANKNIYSSSSLLWPEYRYKKDCEEANISPTYYRRVAVAGTLFIILLIILILTLAYAY